MERAACNLKGSLIRINQKKYGITFEEAQSVFEDIDALRIFEPDPSENEDRLFLLGVSAKVKILVVCHCYRENDAKTGSFPHVKPYKENHQLAKRGNNHA